MNYNELYHHGILGMHWGIRRFQPYPKGHKGGREVGQAAKVQQRGISGLIQKHKQKVAVKKRTENLKKAREAAAAKRKHDADKERVLREGNATEILKYKGELTNKELGDAVARINYETRLSEISAKEVKTNMQRINQAMKTVKDINEWTSTGIATYNNIAKIYNATESGKRKKMATIG